MIQNECWKLERWRRLCPSLLLPRGKLLPLAKEALWLLDRVDSLRSNYTSTQQNLHLIAICAVNLLLRCRELANDDWAFAGGDQFSDWEGKLKAALTRVGYSLLLKN